MRAIVVVAAVLVVTHLLQAPERLRNATHDDAAIVGMWSGTATAGTESAEVAVDIRRVKDGVGLFVTLPRLHAWRMPVGYLKRSANGGWEIADWHVTLKRRGDTLVGELGDPRVMFELLRADALPEEVPAPTYPDGPAPDWTYDAGAPLWASVIALDGIAYAADARGTLHAVRSSDGSLVWKRELGSAFYGAPLITTDALFAFNDAGILRKVDRKSGKDMWQAELGGDSSPRVLPAGDVFDFDYHAPAPMLKDDIVYIASSAGVVHALGAATGKPQWRVDVKARVRATVGVSSSQVFVGTLGNDLIALDRASGAERWRFKATGPVTSAPGVFGDLVLFGNRGSWITALHAADGTPAWSRYDWFSWIESDGRFVDDVYYVGSSDLRAVRALDPKSGKPLWEVDVLGWAWGTPAVTRDTVYVGVAAPQKYVTRHAAGLVALDRKTGAVRWRRPVPLGESFVSGYTGSVAIEGNVLIAPNVSGRLEGYKLR